MTEFERITEIVAAYDKRDPEPSKNYGIHGVEMRFVLKNDEGAVQFVLYTNWHLPSVYAVPDTDGGLGMAMLSYRRAFAKAAR